MKKKIVASLIAIAAPAIIQAAGMSVYVPYTFEHSVDGTSHSDRYYDWSSGTYVASGDYDYDYKLKSKVGDIGLAFSTNIGKDKLFGYTIALELKSPQATTSDKSFTRYDMLHTFEFGVVRTEVVRLWVGPRINLSTNHYETDTYTRTGVEFGAAAALGLNINLGNYFAITSSLDYKMAWQSGTYEGKSSSSVYSGTYNQTNTGATLRVGVAVKFGEEFEASFY